MLLVAYATGRPDGGFLSSSQIASPAAPGAQQGQPKKPSDRNIDRQANVVATLQAVNGADNLDQTDNNQGDKNNYFNSIFAASSFLDVKDSAGNVVGGLQEAKGTNNVTQNTNGDNNQNNVKNRISKSNAASIVSFDAANTSGKAMLISGTNEIGQDQNNDAGINEFTNM